MERFFTVFGLLMMVLLPVGFLIGLCHDLAHPELWCDVQHDPRVYGTAALVAVPLMAWYAIRQLRG